MARATLFATIVLSCLLLQNSAEDKMKYSTRCGTFHCGKYYLLKFPFAPISSPDCGPLHIRGCNETKPEMKLGSKWLRVENILLDLKSGKGTPTTPTIAVYDKEFDHSENCDFNGLTLSSNRSFQLTVRRNTTFLKCSHSVNLSRKGYKLYSCGHYNYYYAHSLKPEPKCSKIVLPVRAKHSNGENNLLNLLDPYYLIKVQGKDGAMNMPISDKEDGHALEIGLGTGIPAILMTGLLVYFLYRRRKRKYGSPDTFSASTSYPSNADLEEGGAYCGVPVFSYKELEEATKNFDSSKELGDGGFGTVYFGKLKDGREVAVKRLYEHNYRRVEQFINEIEILTRLRHKNLVSLYGCTSRQSRELLLVYEYIPNGTVADHLHGDRAKPGSLNWSTRMSIAIETAKALAYLHASDIIHRDVKTNNILLDNNFCVKVADFGLSRLFPNDVTHVSTAPQGTPGYVDPEYHQCYQLTDKSDVYSFGVVLVELISSMPAVDITRHRHEINLSNLAIAKIQKKAYSELVDPTLGFESDSSIKKMVKLVSELAFRCLQQDKEMRPSMDEVLEALEDIASGELELVSLEKAHTENAESESVLPPASPECDEVGLLKISRQPSSPISVAEKWISRSTTPNSSA